jgi:hypothetical protein
MPRTRRLARAAFAAAALSCAAGCAPATSFQGISLTSKSVSPELRNLAERAAGGDKRAQLELGIRFEEGRGVAPDWRRAERLYAMAAASSGGTMMIYVPPVRPGGSGSVMPVNTGPAVPGLAEARERLHALRRRRAAEGAPRRI